MAEKTKKTQEGRCCPYCDAEIAEAAFPFCNACGVKVLTCPSCHNPVPRDKEACPTCGADLADSGSEE